MVTEVPKTSRSSGQRSRSGHRSRSAGTQARSSNENGDLNLADRPRRVSASNCCNYCDHYHPGEMTHNKHLDIEAWRTDVNRNLANETRSAAQSQRQEEASRKYKLIYLKYSPPGSPDKEPGFRRIPSSQNGTRKDARKQRQWQGDFDMESISTDLGSISLDVGDRSDYFGRQQPSTMGSGTNRSNKTSKTSASAKSDATCLSTGTEFSRSNSNRLLNVLTIDDYKYRYGSTYSKVTNELGEPSANEVQKKAESMTSKSRQSQRPVSTVPSGRNSTSDVTFDLHSNLGSQANYQNETVERAYDIVKSSKKPVNNEAHRDLYRQPKVPAPHSAKQSKRFQKLHKALHKWMEDEIMRPHSMRMTTASSPQPLSTYSQKMDSPNWLNGAPDPGYSSARRSSRKSRRSQLSSNNDSGIVNEDLGFSPLKRDNNAFLEMLMEMEDSHHDSTLETIQS